MEFQRKKSNLKCKGLVFVNLSFILVKFAENFVFAIIFVSFVLTWNPSKISLTMYKKFVSKTLNLPQTTRFGQSLIKDNKWYIKNAKSIEKYNIITGYTFNFK